MGGLADPKRLRKLYEHWHEASKTGARPADDLDLDGSDTQFSGYSAIHLTVKVPERLRPRDLTPQAEAIWAGRVVEIQAGTVIMHAWAEIEHDITYKSHGRGVPSDEKAMLDMLNGLALASEVGMRSFKSPSMSESPATRSEEEVRSWLHQFYIKENRSTPSEWVDVDLLRGYLKDHKNQRNEFLNLAKEAWSMLEGHESRMGLKLDHFLPRVIMHNNQMTYEVLNDLIEAACRGVGLLQAAYDGQEAVVRLLLEKGVDKESKGVGKESKGVDNESKGVDKKSKGVDIESKDSDGDTPLSLAAIRGHEAVVRLLLENGADQEARNRNGSTPLLWAAARGREAVVRLLLENGASWEAKDNDGNTALSWAARQGHEAVEQLLRDKAAAERTSADDDLNPTPPSSATKGDQDSGAGLLLNKGMRIEPASADSMRPPSPVAAEKTRQAVVRLLLEKGADTESAGRSEKTPLLLAAEEGDEAAVKRLLDAGNVDVDSKNQYGSTPLSRAAGFGRGAVVKLLLGTGKVEIDSKNQYGFTLLARAAYNGHETVVRQLLDTGKVDVDSKNQDGGTPLSWAAEMGHEAIVELLLNTSNVDVDLKNRYGFTPLSRAAGNGHEAVVKRLLDTVQHKIQAPEAVDVGNRDRTRELSRRGARPETCLPRPSAGGAGNGFYDQEKLIGCCDPLVKPPPSSSPSSSPSSVESLPPPSEPPKYAPVAAQKAGPTVSATDKHTGPAPFAAYLCGWAYVVGDITVTLAVQFGTTVFFAACTNMFQTEAADPIWRGTTYRVFLVFLGVALRCSAISIFWQPLPSCAASPAPRPRRAAPGPLPATVPSRAPDGGARSVHPTLDLPLNAMKLSMVIQIALGLIWFGSPVVFNALSGVGVISLTLAYAMAIVAAVIGRREQMKGAKFPLGKFAWLANSIALAGSGVRPRYRLISYPLRHRQRLRCQLPGAPLPVPCRMARNPPITATLPVVVFFQLKNVYFVVAPFVPSEGGQNSHDHLPYWIHCAVSIDIVFVGGVYWFVWAAAPPRIAEYELGRETVVDPIAGQERTAFFQ
ncbi:hypothetical protein GGTG_13407 [Gaeumannomyces tritici R3-111a-1]|uniref:Uncharacterized protein n=1 Tax=Gaeumannomyces tritici (strain R3-111a-1) TaxID=644352 RepID=J3PIS8_GAET3|nr:hypothetical protein GGTG_13407 [Gaeumannomyces tritici R3-111a-1]EJT69010.1 hypothetical protein GGTG_13407 [Gaeumannomyces tritici R3-111a-1]